jgi:hypothetical protein
MLTMSKKKPQPPRKGKPLHVWLDDVLRDAVEAERKGNRRSLRDEVSLLLEEALAARGKWPPADQDDDA